MSYQVWKCEYCFETDINKSIIDRHEKTCYANKDNHKCFTCKYYKEVGYPISGSDMRCMCKEALTYNKNIDWFFDDFTKEEEEKFYPCSYWEENK